MGFWAVSRQSHCELARDRCWHRVVIPCKNVSVWLPVFDVALFMQNLSSAIAAGVLWAGSMKTATTSPVIDGGIAATTLPPHQWLDRCSSVGSRPRTSEQRLDGHFTSGSARRPAGSCVRGAVLGEIAVPVWRICLDDLFQHRSGAVSRLAGREDQSRVGAVWTKAALIGGWGLRSQSGIQFRGLWLVIHHCGMVMFA